MNGDKSSYRIPAEPSYLIPDNSKIDDAKKNLNIGRCFITIAMK